MNCRMPNGSRPAAAARVVAGQAAVGRPHGAQRDRGEVPHRDRSAGRTRAVRSVGHTADLVPPAGTGRHVRADAAGRPDEGGHRRGRRLARAGRLHRRPCPPARRRGPRQGLRASALGRSRGGLISCIHACDAAGRPLAPYVSAAPATADMVPHPPPQVRRRTAPPRANAGFEPSARRPTSVMTSAPGQRRSPAQGMTR